MYKSLAESQIKREEEIAANPLSRPELEVRPVTWDTMLELPERT